MTTVSANNKRIAKNTLMLYIRMFFIMAVTLYTSRVFLKTLGVEDFGIYNVVGGVVAMMGFLKGAMSAATTRFITYEIGRNDFEQLRKTYCISMMIYGFICFAFVVLAETIGLWFLNNQLIIPDSRMAAANWVYQFTILSVVIDMMAQPYNAVIISHERMSFFAYISILEVILKLLIVYMLAIQPYDNLAVYGILVFCVSLIVRILYSIYCKKNFRECKFRVYRDKGLFLRLLSYSGWNLFGSISSLVKGQGLNILLNMFFCPAVNAARGIAFQIGSAISQFSHNFFTAVRPQIIKYYAQNDLNNMFLLVFRSSRFSFYLNLFFSVPLLIETPQIIQLWLGQTPEYVIVFSRLIIVISAIDAMAHPMMTAAHATGRVALYQSVVGMMNILILPISYLILRWGHSPVSVFWVSLVVTSVNVLLRVLIVKYLIKSFPLMNYLFQVCGSCLLVSLLSFIMPISFYKILAPNLWNDILICLVCVLSVIACVYLVGLTTDEKKLTNDIFKNKLLALVKIKK